MAAIPSFPLWCRFRDATRPASLSQRQDSWLPISADFRDAGQFCSSRPTSADLQRPQRDRGRRDAAPGPSHSVPWRHPHPQVLVARNWTADAAACSERHSWREILRSLPRIGWPCSRRGGEEHARGGVLPHAPRSDCRLSTGAPLQCRKLLRCDTGKRSTAILGTTVSRGRMAASDRGALDPLPSVLSALRAAAAPGMREVAPNAARGQRANRA